MTSVMTISLTFIWYHMLQSESSICEGGFPNIMNIYVMSCDIIIICFPDRAIFILLECFKQLLQIQRLAKYYLRFTLSLF